jgi:hypothetical protein
MSTPTSARANVEVGRRTNVDGSYRRVGTSVVAYLVAVAAFDILVRVGLRRVRRWRRRVKIVATEFDEISFDSGNRSFIVGFNDFEGGKEGVQVFLRQFKTD